MIFSVSSSLAPSGWLTIDSSDPDSDEPDPGTRQPWLSPAVVDFNVDVDPELWSPTETEDFGIDFYEQTLDELRLSDLSIGTVPRDDEAEGGGNEDYDLSALYYQLPLSDFCIETLGDDEAEGSGNEDYDLSTLYDQLSLSDFCIETIGDDEIEGRGNEVYYSLALEAEVEAEQPRWESLGPYGRWQRILLVGEGDFSFSASLAVAFGDASNMVATSLDSYGFLAKNYKNAMGKILELEIRGCKVMHGVDTTKMAKHPELRPLKFNCIIFNFPHSGFSTRAEPRHVQISQHQALVRGFMANAKKMIECDGQIHITHKCNGFFREWNIEMLGLCEDLRLVEAVPFNFRDYPGYHTKFGYGGDKDFDCNPSKTYKFQLALAQGWA